MKIIDPTFEMVYVPDTTSAYWQIATAMRNCYRAELNAMPATDEELIEKAMKRGHMSVIEFASASFNIICDRGVTHELVRHRLASYAQESTRYCNYAGEKFGRELTFIRPSWVVKDPEAATDTSLKYEIWLKQMASAEAAYMELLDAGASAQEARAVLPNSLAAKIAMNCNFREWIHVFRLRCDMPAHPDMRTTMWPILNFMVERFPAVFSKVHNWLVDKGARL